MKESPPRASGVGKVGVPELGLLLALWGGWGGEPRSLNFCFPSSTSGYVTECKPGKPSTSVPSNAEAGTLVGEDDRHPF